MRWMEFGNSGPVQASNNELTWKLCFVLLVFLRLLQFQHECGCKARHNCNKISGSTSGQCLRWLCVLLLQLLEVALPINLLHVEGAAAGEEFLLFFSGTVGPIPFERIHLPAFVLPRLHAPLSSLISPNPLVGQRIRKNANPPVAHPGLLASWKLSADVSVLPFDLDVRLRMRDGSISTFQGSLLSDECLHASCQSSGSLDRDKLQVDVDSFTITSTKLSEAKGIRGGASIEVALADVDPFEKIQKISLPDHLFTAARQGLKPSSLVLGFKVNLAESQLPEEFLVIFRDEHPLMLGSANVAARLQRLSLHGNLSLQGLTLPTQRKRDLLRLPITDLHFDASLELEEEMDV